MLTSIGMIMGLVVAALITQLILSAGASLITISFSALTYVDVYKRQRSPWAVPGACAS